MLVWAILNSSAEHLRDMVIGERSFKEEYHQPTQTRGLIYLHTAFSEMCLSSMSEVQSHIPEGHWFLWLHCQEPSNHPAFLCIYPLGTSGALNRQNSPVKTKKTVRLCYYRRCYHHALELRAYFLSQERGSRWFSTPLIASDVWACIPMRVGRHSSSSLNCHSFHWVLLVSFFLIICKDC